MADVLAEPIALALGWLTTYLLHSTVLIGAAWLLMRVVALQPGTRDLLWRVSLLGGIATATAATIGAPEPADLHLVRRTIRAEVTVAPSESGLQQAPLGWETVRETPSGVRRFETRLRRVSPECRALVRAGPTPSAAWLEHVREMCGPGPAPAWQLVVVLIWIAGAGPGLWSIAADRWSLRELRASLRPAGSRTERLLRSVDGGRGRARSMTSPLLAGPCAMTGGIIGISERCVEELDDAQLSAVLAHELAHVARRDPTWSTIVRMLVAVAWMQPLNRLARREGLVAAEEACDDWALTRTGERRSLASSIARVATWMAAVPAPGATTSMAGTGGGSASSRIRRILAAPPRPEPAWVRLVCVFLVTAPLFVVPAVPLPTPPRTAILVEETGVLTDVDPGARTSERAAATRIFVARIRSD